MEYEHNCPGGGGWPLIINGEFRGAVLASGLYHADDHMLIIKAIEQLKRKRS